MVDAVAVHGHGASALSARDVSMRGIRRVLRVRQLGWHSMRLAAVAVRVVAHATVAAVALAGAKRGKLHASVVRLRVAAVHTDVSRVLTRWKKTRWKKEQT